jgi:hypothetical protein
VVNKRNIFYGNITFIQSKCFSSLRPGVLGRNRYSAANLPEGKFIFHGKEFFYYDKSEIGFCIIAGRSVRPDMQIEFFVADEVLDNSFEIVF